MASSTFGRSISRAGRLFVASSPSLTSGQWMVCGTRTMATGGGRMVAPPMVYIRGEEMTRYCMDLIMEQWIEPHIDTTAWEFYDLSCKARDESNDKVLTDAVAAGARLKAIFKEPTITPTEVQRKALGLKRAFGSPNGAMRRGWNGITISRDTIHIEGIELGFKKPVLFERHAVGGEYSAGFKFVGRGNVKTVFNPEEGGDQVIVDERNLTDDMSAVVTYDNPLDNVVDLAHHFFSRCLAMGITPYVVTKKTVFKWQEGFWIRMSDVFEKHYKEQFLEAGLLDNCGGQLQHLISDAATMQIIRWTGGGFGMAAHNYDGDMLTDQIAEVHRSPGFITSNLTGKAADGSIIKEFEASHGTVADMWHAHQRGEETSLNPLGMVEALIGAMQHSAVIDTSNEDRAKIKDFTIGLRKAMHVAMASGNGTRDLCGPEGLTTEAFVGHIAKQMEHYLAGGSLEAPPATTQAPLAPSPAEQEVDVEAMKAMFLNLDLDGNGVIDFEEFTKGLVRLNVHPQKLGF